MIPGAIAGANLTLGKPRDMTDQECHPLRVRVEEVQYAEGIMRTFTSAWQPTPAELERLNKGASVHLTIVAAGHPPVIVGVGECE